MENESSLSLEEGWTVAGARADIPRNCHLISRGTYVLMSNEFELVNQTKRNALMDTNPRKKGGNKHPRRSGVSTRKAPKTITLNRTKELLDAALKVWGLKHDIRW